MIGKFLIFCIAMLTLCNARSMMLCEQYTCASYDLGMKRNFKAIRGCVGAIYNNTPVSWFEVYGGCSYEPGIGGWSAPVWQSPQVISLATGAAGHMCYCALKSVNGVAVSSLWYKSNNRIWEEDCAHHCTDDCSYDAKTYPHIRQFYFPE